VKKSIFAAIALTATSAFAASTGTLIISGTVSAINDISIVATTDATNLNITGGNSGLVVANVSETSNNLNGYSIKLRSLNASKLVHSVDATKFTTYKVSYDGGTMISLTTSDQVVKTSGSLSGLTTDSSAVAVDVVPYSTAPAGTYSDTITISISAN